MPAFLIQPAARLVAMLLTLAALIGAASASAAASLSVTWSGGRASGVGAELESLACVSPQVCLGLTKNDRLALSHAPSTTASWHLSGHRRVQSLSCDPPWCFISIEGRPFRYDLYVSRHPAGGLASFRRVARDHWQGVESITCPTQSFCADLDASPEWAWLSQTPSRPGSWRRRVGPIGSLTIDTYNSLACPSSAVCLAYATYGYTEQVAILTNPLDPRSQWRSMNADPLAVTNGEQFKGGTCVAAAACLLTADYGAIVTSPDISVATPNWTRTVIYGPGNQRRGEYRLADPVCFGVDRCYLLGARGDLLVSTVPFAADPTAWQVVHLPGAQPSDWERSLSCPSAEVCFVLVTTPHHGQHIWRAEVDVAGSVACRSASSCPAVDYAQPSVVHNRISSYFYNAYFGQFDTLRLRHAQSTLTEHKLVMRGTCNPHEPMDPQDNTKQIADDTTDIASTITFTYCTKIHGRYATRRLTHRQVGTTTAEHVAYAPLLSKLGDAVARSVPAKESHNGLAYAHGPAYRIESNAKRYVVFYAGQTGQLKEVIGRQDKAPEAVFYK